MNVIPTTEELLLQHEAPTQLRIDNRPEFMAHALQEWCKVHGSGMAGIPPGSPWENPFMASLSASLDCVYNGR